MSEVDATITTEALSIVNGSRQKAYDAPERNFHRIALAWEAITDRAYTPAEVGLMFVALKIVRESHQHQRDNFVDAVGYLLCADAVRETTVPVPLVGPGATNIAFCKSPPCSLPAHPESRTPHQERAA